MAEPQQASPFEGVTEGTSLLELIRRAVESSPAASFGAEATGIPSIGRVASGDSTVLDKADAAMTLADFLLPMIPIAALYHGTSSLRVPGILRRGLQARRDAGLNISNPVQEGKRLAAFLTQNPEIAKFFAGKKAQGDIAKTLSSLEPPFPDIYNTIDEAVYPVVLRFPDELAASGVPDVHFPHEEAIMFPQGVKPENIQGGSAFFPDPMEASPMRRQFTEPSGELEKDELDQLVQRTMDLWTSLMKGSKRGPR